MKTAVGVIFTAALGTALPHVDRSTTTFSSRCTDAANESEIPWVEYKGDSHACIDAVRNKATRQKLEEACGTENFCDLWDPEYGPDNLKDKSERYGYANKTECLAAHEPAHTKPQSKIPWVEYKGDSHACIDAVRNKATRQKLEEACGTENFCDLWDPEYGSDNLKDKSERYGYANKTECLAAHEPKP